MFKFTYEARYGDYKSLDEMKIGSVMDIIQDISTKSSASSGYPIEKLQEMKRAWLLKGYNIHFEDVIDPRAVIDVYTAVKPPKGATSKRGCIIEKNGKIKAKSIADWFLFDTEKLKPVRVPDKLASAYDTADFNDDFFEFKKPVILPEAKAEYKIRVSNKDIDTNMHLNNQRSADLMMDALSYDFKIRDIRLLYKKPCFLGDELSVCVEEIENGYYVHLKNSDDEICVIGTFTS